MSDALVLAPITLAVTLLLAAVAKFRAPQSLTEGAASLKVPGPLASPLVLRAVPVVEVILAVGLLGGRGWLFGAFALGALALMVAYLLLVVRAVNAGDAASCGCFGEADGTVDQWTIARNALLTLAGAAALAMALSGRDTLDILGSGGAVWGWLLAAAFVPALLWVSTRHSGSPVAASAAAAPGEGAEFDYVRVPIPPVGVQNESGEWLTMDSVPAVRPVLVLMVNPGCGACAGVDDLVPEWRERLPEVDIRGVFQSANTAFPTFPNLSEGRLLDPNRSFGKAIGSKWAPAAALLGTDRLMAGGPVGGVGAIKALIDDIEAELITARAEGLLPVPGADAPESPLPAAE